MERRMSSLSASSEAKPKNLHKARKWLRKKSGFGSFSGCEESEGSISLRHMSDNEGLGGVREDTPEWDAQATSRKERRKFDPRRLVGSRSTLEFSSMSQPPRGYLWIWLGHFKRWHRRFFIISTPGALAYAKRHDLKGNDWTMSLSGASIVLGKANSRQFLLVTPTRTLYLRTISRESREMWVAGLEQSIQTYTQMEKRAKEQLSHFPRLSHDHFAALEVDPQMQKLQRDLWLRMQAKMARLQPHQQGLESRLEQIAQGMSQVWSSLGCSPASMPEQAKVYQEQAPLPRESPSSSKLNNGSASLPPMQTSSSAWDGYVNLMTAVEQVVRDEAVLVLELQAENHALRKLLREKQVDSRLLRRSSILSKNAADAAASDVHGQRSEPQETQEIESVTTSQSYSTAGSRIHNDEDEDDHPLVFETDGLVPGTSMHSPTQPMLDSDLITALETVRHVEYATKGRTISELSDDEAREPPGDNNDLDDMDITAQEDSDTSSPTAAARARLPCPKPLRRGFSIWSILKNAIGRDLSRITLPATINEPLSALQRVAEEFEYYSLLEKAAICNDPQERLLHVTAFVLSSYNSGLLRDNKPFNPLLGETFEWQDDHLQFLAEQVSHHPPVSCFSARGGASAHEQPLFIVHGEFELKSKFWGKTLSVFPSGRCDLCFPYLNEQYVWNKSNLSIHNIIIGKLWLDFHGEIRVQNISSGAYSLVNIPKCTSSWSTRGDVQGHLIASNGEVSHEIHGNYTSTIYAHQSDQNNLADGAMEIFRCNDPPDDSEEQYNMTTFAIGLNDFQRPGPLDLPPTDARFRPDVRALENGEFDLATNEKLRLEEKQRHSRRVRKEAGIKHVPLWFKFRNENDKDIVKPASQGSSPAWEFNEAYWAKNQSDWEICPDIY